MNKDHIVIHIRIQCSKCGHKWNVPEEHLHWGVEGQASGGVGVGVCYGYHNCPKCNELQKIEFDAI